MTLEGHDGVMAEEEEVVNDGMIGKMRRKDESIDNLNRTVTGLKEVIGENEKAHEEHISGVSNMYAEELQKKDREIEDLRRDMDLSLIHI